MLNPGTSKAPASWKGDEDELAEFLDRFEALADNAGLSEADKAKYSGKYVGRKHSSPYLKSLMVYRPEIGLLLLSAFATCFVSSKGGKRPLEAYDDQSDAGREGDDTLSGDTAFINLLTSSHASGSTKLYFCRTGSSR